MSEHPKTETTSATETTAVGEQTLMGGVAPVTLRARLETVGRRPLSAGPTARQFWGAPPKAQQPCDHGLFDDVGRAQTDLCDFIADLPNPQPDLTPEGE